jgi:hypothetical protein
MKNNLLLTLLLTLLGSTIASADPKGIHGMLIFGNQTTYGSHLPMYHAPHDYQALFQFRLKEETGGSTVANYNKAKETTSSYFTIVPEPMDLTRLLNASKKTFRASLYEGHFERGGRNLGPLIVDVEKVIFSRKLSPTDSSPRGDDYLLFGQGGEYFAAHLIGGAPNLDRVLEVSQPRKTFPSTCRTQACPELPSEPVSDQDLPLRVSSGFSSAGTPYVPNEADTLFDSGIQTKIKKVIYSETGDLEE